MIGMPSMPELLIIAFVVVILFGAKRVPEIFKSAGQTVKEMKKIGKEVDDL